MKWLTNTLGSSIGKKLLMAFTGLGFCGFLTTHLAGNLTLYAGADAFNSYAEHLHALGPLIIVAEWGLLLLAVVHILTGVILFWSNYTARPRRYMKNKWAGGRTLGSAAMPYTGLFLLGFIILHLMNFHFVDKTGTTIYRIVATAFNNTGLVIFYILAMVAAAVHVSHGLWSAFQTLGIHHAKYTPLIKGMGLAFSVVVGVGFGFIPVYLFLNG